MYNMDLTGLSEEEQSKILRVLRRDESLRRHDNDRVKTLRADIKRIRLSGVIREGQDADKTCTRCREPFGWFFNKGAVCPKCQFKVCEKCRVDENGKQWMCSLCSKQKELEVVSGQWFYSRFRKSKRHRKTNEVITGSQLVKASFRRRPHEEMNGGGTAARGRSVSEDLRRALTNNNASAGKDAVQAGAAKQKGTERINSAAFPQDTDRQLLMDLIRPGMAGGSPKQGTVQVRRVSTQRYQSDSSSSGSEPNSPQLSHKDSMFSDSVRSSIRSSRSSAADSLGGITVVTDYDAQSMVSYQDTPDLLRTNNALSPLAKRNPPLTKEIDRRSPDSVIDHPSNSSQIGDSSSTLSEDPDVYTVTVVRRRQDSGSSGSEGEFVTQRVTQIRHPSTSRDTHRTTSPAPSSSSTDTHHKAFSKSDDQITCRNEGVGPSKAHFLACEGDTGGNTNTQTVHVSGAGIRMGNGLDHSDSIRSTSSKTSDSSDDFSRTVRTKVEAMLASNNYVGRSDFKGGRAYHGVGVEGSSSSSGSSTPDRVVEPRSNPKGVLVTMHDPDDHTNGEGQRMTSKSPHTVHFDELSFQPLEHSSDNDDADIENSSFEDLEWEAEMLFSNSKTNIAENNDVSELVVNTEIPKIKIIPTVDELQTLRADLEQELQPQCVGENGRPGSPSEVFNVGRNLDHQMEADYLDANDGGDFYRVNNYNSSQFSKMYLPRSDDDESLSVISERTEPMGSDFYDSDISDGSHGSSSSSSTEVDEEQYIQVLVTSKETGKSGAVFEIEKNKAKHFMRGISPHPTKVEVSPVTNSAPVYNLEANIKPKLHNQVDNIIVQTEMLEKRDSITKLAEDAQSLADSSITDGSMTEEDEFSQILEDNRKYVTEAELEEIMSSFTEDPSINSSSDNISINQLSPIDVTHKKKDNIPKSPPAIVIFPETPRGESPDEQYKSPAQSTHVTRGATGGVVKVKKPIRQDSDPVDASHLHHVDEIQKMFEEPPKMMVCHKSPPKEKSVSVLREVPVDTEVLSFNVASPPSHADEENAQLSPSSVETSNVKCGPVVERIDLSVDDTISASQLITVPDDPSVTDRQSSFESVISVPDQFKNNHSAERAVDDSEEYALGGELSAYETVEHAANASPPSGDNQIINNEPCTPPHDHTDAHVYATAILKSSTDSLNSSSSELDVQMPIATGTPISSSEGYYDGLLSSMTEGTPTPGLSSNDADMNAAVAGHLVTSTPVAHDSPDAVSLQSRDAISVTSARRYADENQNEAGKVVKPKSEIGAENTSLRSNGQPGTPVPSIAISPAERNDAKSVRSDIDDDMENIDDLVASYNDSTTPSIGKGHDDSMASQHSNLLSTFSTSRESIVSYYSDAGEGNYGKVPVTGDLHMGLEYIYKTGTLELKIKRCKDLAAVDPKRKRSDPYVKTYLLPDKTKNGKRKTRVKKHTLNPTYDETIRYTMTKSELETRTLWVAVWHNDTFGRNTFLGEITMPLDYHNFEDTTPRWYRLMDRNPSPLSLLTYKGDLVVSLKFVTPDNVMNKKKPTQNGQLHVLVKQARNLTAVRANGSSDPFCKGYLLPERSRNSKQKTPVVKKECNPQWNHTFVFEEVAWDELRIRCLELTVWDHDRFTSNDFLGGVRLNLGTGKNQGREVDWMDAKGEEVSLWQGMLDRPNYWIDGTLMLRPNMDKRK